MKPIVLAHQEYFTFNFQADFEKEYDIVQKIGEVCANFFGVNNNNFSYLSKDAVKSIVRCHLTNSVCFVI